MSTGQLQKRNRQLIVAALHTALAPSQPTHLSPLLWVAPFASGSDVFQIAARNAQEGAHAILKLINAQGDQARVLKVLAPHIFAARRPSHPKHYASANGRSPRQTPELNGHRLRLEVRQ